MVIVNVNRKRRLMKNCEAVLDRLDILWNKISRCNKMVVVDKTYKYTMRLKIVT